jgi:tight adherence protein B
VEPQLSAIFAALLVALALLFGALGVRTALTFSRRRTRARLDSIAGEPQAAAAEAARPEALRRTGGFDRRLGSSPGASGLRRDLQRAGLAWQVKDYLGIVALSGLAIAVPVALVAQSAMLGLLAFALGAIAPMLLVKRRAAKRSARFNEQVVDMIDLVASSLRSGFGFMQSLEVASREQSDPISGELQRTIREINLGMSTEDALARLVERTSDPDLELVVTAVLIQRRVGGNLAEVLGNISAMIRDRMRVRGEIRTLTAQSRLSALIVGLLPVGLGAVLTAMHPQMMSVLFTDPAGQLLLGAALVLEVIGFLMVRRIAAIDY